jgi:O-antigen/teichoic acid export membrane protein
MVAVRRALLFASAERYFVLAVNFVMVAIVSRLLTPEDVGLSVIGTAAIATAESLRDCPTSYLIQKKDLSRDETQTTFVVMLTLTVLLAGIFWVIATPLSAFYKQPDLIAFLHVVSFALLPGPFERPIMALLRRDMQFGTLAFINICTAAVSAVLTVALAVLGFRYMSFAWAALAGNATAVVLALYFRPDWWIYKRQMRAWRQVIAFGGYNSATAVLNQVYEWLPYFVLGRAVSLDAVGLYSRAIMVCQLPAKCTLTIVAPVALSAFAAEARQGHSLKSPFLRTLEYFTVVQWPALALVSLLADPVVSLLLGQQWLNIVPLVRVIAIAYMFSFISVLGYQVFVAVGGVRDLLISSLVSLPISALAVSISAYFGAEVMAACLLVTVPLQGYVTLSFIRSHVPFRWRELANAVSKSLLVTLASIAGPALYIAVAGFQRDLSVFSAAILAFSALAGWWLGMRVLDHPFLAEVRNVMQTAIRGPVGRRAAAACDRILARTRAGWNQAVATVLSR